MSKPIYRWENPGSYDQLPYGTVIVRYKSSLYGEEEIYTQVSQDSNNPKWESLGMVHGSTAFLDSWDPSSQE